MELDSFSSRTPYDLPPELPPARIVFDVTLDGSARKLITVRSALLVQNKLANAMEVMIRLRGRTVG